MDQVVISPILAMLAILGGNVLILYGSVPAGRILPGLLVGVLLLSFGTTIPEFAITLHAALRPVNCQALAGLAECSSTAINNYSILTKEAFPVAVLIGSCFANLFLVSGLAGLTLRRSYTIESFTYGRDLPALLLTILLVMATAFYWPRVFVGTHEHQKVYVGYVLVAAAVFYMLTVFVTEMMADKKPEDDEDGGGPDLITAIFCILTGTIVLGLGVFSLSNETPHVIQFFTRQTVDFQNIQDENRILYIKYGLLFVGLAVAIPEMLVTLFAWLRRDSSKVTGNFIGSSIFNLLGVLGFGILLSNGDMLDGLTWDFLYLDFAILFGGAVFLAVLLRTGRRLEPIEGLFLILFYAAYWAWRFFGHWPLMSS